MSAEYQPVQIVDLKIHMLRTPDNDTPSGLLRLITDQGIEGWSNEVTADMAHALRGEVRESLIGADAIARNKTWSEFPRWEHDSSSATESSQAQEWLRAVARRTGFGGEMLEWEQIEADTVKIL